MGSKSISGIPTNFTFTLDSGSGGFDVEFSGDPVNPLTIDLGDITLVGNPKEPVTFELIGNPKEPVTFELIGNPKEPVTFDLGLDKICVSLALTQIPRVRVHIPTRYDFGFCLFGIPIFNFRFAGETMLITEDNPPRIFYKPAMEVGRDQRTVNTREESERESGDMRIKLGDDDD